MVTAACGETAGSDNASATCASVGTETSVPPVQIAEISQARAAASTPSVSVVLSST